MAEQVVGRTRARRAIRSRQLRLLIDLWVQQAAPVLDGIYAQFGGDNPRRLKARMTKEVGYRHRLGRLLPEDGTRDVVGSDVASCLKAVMELSSQQGEVVVLPSADDRDLVGRAAYRGANPPNPYQWVPVLARHTKEGAVVWEMGPGVWSRAGGSARCCRGTSGSCSCPHPARQPTSSARRFHSSPGPKSRRTP